MKTRSQVQRQQLTEKPDIQDKIKNSKNVKNHQENQKKKQQHKSITKEIVIEEQQIQQQSQYSQINDGNTHFLLEQKQEETSYKSQQEQNLQLITKEVQIEDAVDEKQEYLELLTNIRISLQQFKQNQFEALLKCINLKILTLGFFCNIEQKKKLVLLSEVFKKLKILDEVHLNFYNSYILQNDLKYLLQTIFSTKQIITLKFKFNHCIGPQNLTYLAIQLMELPNLQILEIKLSNYLIKSQDILRLAQGISQCKKLNKLSLDLAQIKYAKPKMLIKYLAQCQQLNHFTLNLLDNKIESKQFSFLGEELEIFVNLRYLNLNLSHNEIEDDGAAAIVQGITKITDIQHLILNLNNNKKITNEGIISICQQLLKIADLKSLALNFYYCNILQSGLIKLFQTFNSFKLLERLSLSLGNYDQENPQILKYLTDGIDGLQNLYFLSIYANLNDGEENSIIELHKRLVIFKSLRYLELCLHSKQRYQHLLQKIYCQIKKIPQLVYFSIYLS